MHEFTHRCGRGGAVRRVLIGILVTIAVVVAAGALLGPTIAGGYTAGVIERAVGERIAGRVEVSGMSLSWAGPQAAGSVEVFTPDGDRVADVSVTVERPLLGLLFADGARRDLGEVAIGGRVSAERGEDGAWSLARALESASDPAPDGPVLGPDETADAHEPLTLPNGVEATLRLVAIDVAVSPGGRNASGDAARPIEGTLDGTLVYAPGRPVRAELSLVRAGAVGDPVTLLALTAELADLVAEDGSLTTADASGPIRLELRAPTELVARVLDERAGGAGETGGGVEGLAAVRVAGGRIELDAEGGGVGLRGMLPAAVATRLASGEGAGRGGAAATFTDDVGFELVTNALSVPLPPRGDPGAWDLRDATFVAQLETTAASARVRADEGVGTVRVDPLRGGVSLIEGAGGFIVSAETSASYEGEPAGSVLLDVRATGWLDNDGTLRSGPEFVRARAMASGTPAALLAPVLERAGLRPSEVLGETVSVDVRAGMRTAAGDGEAFITVGDRRVELPEVGVPYVAASLASRLTSVWASLEFDDRSVRSREGGVQVQTDAAGAMLRPLLDGSGYTARAGGTAILDVTGFSVPIAAAGATGGAGGGLLGSLRLDDLRGRVRLLAGDVGLTRDETGDSVLLESIDLGFSSGGLGTGMDVAAAAATGSAAEPGEPRWGVDVRGVQNGQRFAVRGGGRVLGVPAEAPIGPESAARVLATATPEGSVDFISMPSRLGSLVSPDVRETLGALLGERFKGRVVLGVDEGSPAGLAAGLSFEGDGGLIDGTVVVERRPAGSASGGLVGAVRAEELRAVLLDPAGAADLLPAGARVEVLPGGRAEVTLRDARLGLGAGAGGAGVDPADGRGTVRVELTDVRVRAAAGGEPIEAVLDGPISVAWDGSAAVMDAAVTGGSPGAGGGSPMRIAGRVEAAGLAAGFSQTRLTGSVEATGVPGAWVGAAAGAAGPELAAAAAELAGERLDVSARAEPAGGRRLVVEAQGERATASTSVGFAEGGARFGATAARATLTDAAVAALARLAPADDADAAAGGFGSLGLAAPVEVRGSVEPWTLAFGSGAEAGGTGRGWAAIGAVRVELDEAVLTGVPVGAGRTSAVGLRGVRASYAPSAGHAGGELEASVHEAGPGGEVGARAALVRAEIGSLGPEPSGVVEVREGDPAALDRLLGRSAGREAVLSLEEALGGAFGATLAIGDAADGAGADVGGAAADGAGGGVVFEARSPRLTASGRARAVGPEAGGGYELASPGRFRWIITPEAAAGLRAERARRDGAVGGGGVGGVVGEARRAGERPRLRVATPVELSGRLDVLRAGPAGALFAPDVFAAEGTVAVSSFDVLSGSGAGAQRVRSPALAGSVSTANGGRSAAFELRSEPGEGAVSPGAEALALSGVLRGFADGSGGFTPDEAVLDTMARGTVITALVDVVAGLDGVLIDLVGPVVTLDAELRDYALSREAGRLEATASGDLAAARVSGDVSARALAVSDDSELRVTEITAAGSRRFFRVLLPGFEVFEKTEEEAPAVVSTSGVRVPLGGDLSRLEGTVRVDLGEVRFKTRSVLGNVLRATGNLVSGKAGRRLEPFEVTFTRGVGRYEDVVIPAGEFEVVMSGEIDLVRERAEVLLRVPAYALSGDVSALIENLPIAGAVLGEATTVPILLSGPFDDLKAEVAVDRLGENVGRGLEEGLFKGIEKLIRGTTGGGEEEEESEEEEKGGGAEGGG